MNTEQKIECMDCRATLPKHWISSNVNKPCPNCGSLDKDVILEVIDQLPLPVRESLKTSINDSNFSSKRNPRYEAFQGDDLRIHDGKWMTKKRVIDKNNDRYFEEVKDPETGEIIHYCEEPLSKHFGHGSAKIKK